MLIGSYCATFLFMSKLKMKWLFKYIQLAIVKNDNVNALNIHLRPLYIFSLKNFKKQSIRYKLYPKSYKYQHIQQKNIQISQS